MADGSAAAPRKRSRWDVAGSEAAAAQPTAPPAETCAAASSVIAHDSDLVDEDAQPSNIEHHLPSWNRGYLLMLKMGWNRGMGLGRKEHGIVEPVRITEQYASLGLGKATEYDEYAVAATETRKALLAERMVDEDEGERAAREADAARKQDIAEAVQRENAAFYCDICDKQYAKVMEFENHLSSYDHHHKKRFRDMQQEQRARARASKEASGTKRKERKDPALLAAEAAAAAAAAAAAGASSGSVGTNLGGSSSNSSSNSSSSSSSQSVGPPPPPSSSSSGQQGGSAPPPPPPLPPPQDGVGLTAARAPVKFGGAGSKLGGGLKLGGPKKLAGFAKPGLSKPSAFRDDNEDD